jgi:hypothetical protein
MKNTQTKQARETLQERVKRIVREELKVMLSEQENAVFKKLGPAEKGEFKKWILRQWFSDAKKGAKWYSPKVDESNVLDYVSTHRAFPVTPVQILTMWKDKKSLKTLLPQATKEMEQAQAEEEEERRTYNKDGEETFDKVGKELGVTHQAAAYIEQDGFSKFRQLFGGNPNDMEGSKLDNLNVQIDSARKKAGEAFAKALVASGGDMAKFSATLYGAGYLPKGHAFSREEREALQYIAKQYKPEQIVELLAADIEEDDNLFKSYQMSVARLVFPDKRRKSVG